MKKFFFLILLLIICTGVSQAEEEGSLRSRYEAGIRALEAADYPTAVENFRAILEIRPDMAPVHNLMGVAYLKDENNGLAINSFRQAVQHDPKFAEAYFNLATVYMDEGDPETAAENYRKAVEADPNFGKAYFGLGWFELLEAGRPEEAVKMFRKVVRLEPDFAQAHYGMALAYLRLGNRAMALEPLSVLRSLNRYDLVAELEAMLGSGPREPEPETEMPFEEAPQQEDAFAPPLY